MIRRVVKVGGSLLLRDDLLSALPHWLDCQPPAQTLVIVGGGELIDAIRRLDKVRRINPVETHWLCVNLLDSTLELFALWFGWPQIANEEEFRRATDRGFSSERPTLISARSFYHRDTAISEARLPEDWRTTTDSIAALLAQTVDADELVLLKSCEVSNEATLSELIARGVVDEAFPIEALNSTVIRIEKLKAIDEKA